MNHKTGKPVYQDVSPLSPAGSLHPTKPRAAEKNRPPIEPSKQRYKKRDGKQQKGTQTAVGPRRPLRPDEPGYENTRKGRQQRLFHELLEQVGPNFADTDVRLYLKKRQLNANRQRPSRRGGFPLDDSSDKPGTFLKLKPEFQRTILTERCNALTAALRYQLPAEVAWQLYTHIPGLLTYMTLEVAHKVKALAASTGLHPVELVHYLCSYRPLAFLHPGSVESRLGLIAKLARVDRRQAVQLMSQNPKLWMMNSRLLGPRAEELALMLHCCTIIALKLIAQQPHLLTAQQRSMQHQLTQLLMALDCTEQPAALVPLLLWHPGLLLPPGPAQQHTGSGSDPAEASRQQSSVQQQQQQQLVGDSRKPASPHQVILQLQALAQELDLPLQIARAMVLQSPDLLALLFGSGVDESSRADDLTGGASVTGVSDDTEQNCCAAAVGRLKNSWLCTPTAVEQRQRYQQDIMHLLSPKSKQGKQQQYRKLHLSGGCDRHREAETATMIAASCQWWNRAGPAERASFQRLQPLQQLLVQAPGLLYLAAMPTRSAALQGTLLTPPSAAARTAECDAHAFHTDGLHNQLHCLSQEILREVSRAQQQPPPQQQQQQQLQVAEWPCQRNTVHAEDVMEDRAVQVLQQLQAAAVLEPNMIAQSSSFIVSQLLQLSKVLLISSQQLWNLLQHRPAVLWLTGRQVFNRLRVLCGIFRLPAAQVREQVLTPGVVAILLLDEDQLRMAFNHVVGVAAASGKSEESARNILRQRPELLLPGSLHLTRVIFDKA